MPVSEFLSSPGYRKLVQYLDTYLSPHFQRFENLLSEPRFEALVDSYVRRRLLPIGLGAAVAGGLGTWGTGTLLFHSALRRAPDYVLRDILLRPETLGGAAVGGLAGGLLGKSVPGALAGAALGSLAGRLLLPYLRSRLNM